MLTVVSVLRIPGGNSGIGDCRRDKCKSARLKRGREALVNDVLLGQKHPSVTWRTRVPVADVRQCGLVSLRYAFLYPLQLRSTDLVIGRRRQAQSAAGRYYPSLPFARAGLHLSQKCARHGRAE